MVITQIEDNIKQLISDFGSDKCLPDAFIYELLLAYGHRKQSVTRLRSGERNLATEQGEIIWKRHLYFKKTDGGELHAEIDRMQNENVVSRHKLRFVIATNFERLLAVDTKTHDTLDIEFSELPKHFDFFLPWAGMEKAVYQGENPADVKAAEKMAKLFDLIKADNFDESNKNDTSEIHDLNVFLTRLLFCFFAEDTEIFSTNQFSHAIESHTKVDGSDLTDYLDRLFDVLNTANEKRQNLPDYLSSFPYVNGGLFENNISSPSFSTKSRKMLIECGSELDWSDINPDIFGSMIQAVVHPDQRGGMGMHYTSVTNIMKVIEPLFLNNLYDEFEKHENKPKKLQRLLQRLGEIKIFDPACGSGNFLIIAYKELRRLEMEILKQLQELEYKKTGQNSQAFSEIKLSQFFGVELDDFAHEVAILSLWLTDHQMNMEFKVEFGRVQPSLPLQNAYGVVNGNAIRIEWGDVCPREGEIYILGNPPYMGTRNQKKPHKDDIEFLLSDFHKFKSLDYIACWFYKASLYISGINASYSFVSTNSISQGDQVGVFWPIVLPEELEIFFVHQTFKWQNNAKSNAGVSCVIVGVSNKSSKRDKKIFSGNFERSVKNINYYLVDGGNTVVGRRSKPFSTDFPIMMKGCIPADGGHLLLNEVERNELIKDSRITPFVKEFVGAQEIIDGIRRWCLYIPPERFDEIKDIPEIEERMSGVIKMRMASTKKATNKLASTPYKFAEDRYYNKPSIVVPCHSSENRDYIPMGYINAGPVIYASAQAIYDPTPFVFGMINSKMHMVWVNTTAGKLESRIRYSSAICYNTFPAPNISKEQKDNISNLALNLLSVRENYPDKKLSELYSPDTMPDQLRIAHHKLDKSVDLCYQKESFVDDEDRLRVLFSQYEKLTGV